nr:putative late blight resistance protein homolog R1A-10 isoform X2 [Nicotiana tomentosiformis]
MEKDANKLVRKCDGCQNYAPMIHREEEPLHSVLSPNYNNGSRILLTTGETEVAKYANPSSPHEMHLLDLDNSWKLLRGKVFGPEHDHPPELEEIGKKIVEKCQGLPLTVSVIAGHLSKITRTNKSWKDVARTLGEIISSHPNKCLEVLGLSYHHLPNHLKPCFLSMGGFPEDYQVETWRLIQLWIAEGFLRTSKSGKSLEEVAEDYLVDFISRNLIMVRKSRFNGKIKACGIHDLLREFCLTEVEITKFMRVERIDPVHTLPTQKHNGHRFSFQTRSYSVGDSCKLLPPVTKSIYLFSERRLYLKLDFFSRFSLLRVLAIFDQKFRSFPLVITKLFHLRYLQVQSYDNLPPSWRSTSIKRFVFPTSLKRLTLAGGFCFSWEDISTLVMLPNLEELKLKRNAVSDPIWRLSDEDKFESLKLLLLSELEFGHWEASSESFPSLKRLVMRNCINLKEIPTDFGEICTLESIELHNCSTVVEGCARNIEQEHEDMGNNFLKVYIYNNRSKFYISLINSSIFPIIN